MAKKAGAAGKTRLSKHTKMRPMGTRRKGDKRAGMLRTYARVGMRSPARADYSDTPLTRSIRRQLEPAGAQPRRLQRGEPRSAVSRYGRNRGLGGPAPVRRGCGTVSAYTNHSCRCRRCKDAWAAARRDRRHRSKEGPLWVPKHETQCMVECLLKAGTTKRAIARYLKTDAVRQLDREDRRSVRRVTQESVREVHWKVFMSRAGGPMRAYCQCERPEWVRAAIQTRASLDRELEKTV